MPVETKYQARQTIMGLPIIKENFFEEELMEMVSLHSNDYKDDFDKTHLGLGNGSGNVIEMTSRESKNPQRSNEADYQKIKQPIERHSPIIPLYTNSYQLERSNTIVKKETL